jgi:hypothetical protein
MDGGIGVVVVRKKTYWGGRKPNIVEQGIQIGGGGSLTRFGARLTLYTGFPVSRQAVNNWRKRGAFSRRVVKAVHALTNLPIEDLLEAPWFNRRRVRKATK